MQSSEHIVAKEENQNNSNEANVLVVETKSKESDNAVVDKKDYFENINSKVCDKSENANENKYNVDVEKGTYFEGNKSDKTSEKTEDKKDKEEEIQNISNEVNVLVVETKCEVAEKIIEESDDVIVNEKHYFEDVNNKTCDKSEKVNENKETEEIKEYDSLDKQTKIDLITGDKINERKEVENILLSSDLECCSTVELESDIANDKEVTLEKRSCIDDNPSVNVHQNDIYHLKWFEWKGVQTPIITQNQNGPCPLIAIGNVLILARKIIIPNIYQFITAKQLIEYVGDCILAEYPRNVESEEVQLNHAQNVQDAIDIIYKLQTGIDVNVKFEGVTDFEFTRECIVFDLLQIGLYHGWLVEPHDEVTLKAVNGLSYNQLMDKIISKSDDSEAVAESIAVKEFLDHTATQLTYHGLCELNSTIKEEELCVLFRNNHFSTLYKHKGELFILVTDQGFLTEPAVIWETFCNIEGDSQFVNSEFNSIVVGNVRSGSEKQQTSQNMSSQSSVPHSLSQEDRDYLIALQMQHDEQGLYSTNTDRNIDSYADSDRALAISLQAQENEASSFQQYQHQIPHDQSRQSQHNTEAFRNQEPQQGLKSKCCIL